jgi:rubrerythrin
MWETTLTKSNDPKVLVGFINCLSVLEENAFLLYKAFSGKIEMPLVKSFLLSIAEDSHKHSMLLKGVADSMGKPEKPKDCAKKTGETWRLIDTFYKEISAKEKITESELSQLSEKLAYLESILGEEYYVFVQMKTLQLMVNEINQLYYIDLGSVKTIFVKIINDEEHHREILEKIKNIVNRTAKATDNSPAVKYQNPDAWISSQPSTS